MSDETQTFQSPPWNPEGPDENDLAHVWGSDGDLVATVVENLAYEESHMARACLIAAAPDLLRAAKIGLRYAKKWKKHEEENEPRMDGSAWPGTLDAIDEIEDAIRKAAP